MLKSTYTYRQATPKDADKIISFQIEMAMETEGLQLDSTVCEKGVRAFFMNPQLAQLGKYFVCEKDNKLVGSLLVQKEWSDWRNGFVWWIHSVYIVPSERGNGCFREFYHFIKDLAQSDQEVRGLRLYVDKRNTRAQKVYTAIGMTDEHYNLYEWMKE